LILFKDYEVRHRDTEDLTKAITDSGRLIVDGGPTNPVCVYRVFDANNDTFTTVDEVAPLQSDITVDDPAGFVVGGGCAIRLDANEPISGRTYMYATIATIVGDVITMTTPLIHTVKAGNRVRRVLGDSGNIYTNSMMGYGIPAVASLEWGWKAVLAGDYTGLKLGLNINIEIEFTGSDTGGLDDYAILCETVEDSCTP